MTYVIAEPCIGSKDASCIEVCPVDCIHPTPEEPGFEQVEMLFIDADECIDCGVCAEACPVDAPTLDSDLLPEWHRFAAASVAFYAGRRSAP
jgi:NAD-dependent dihydropyrimidine dehydrogenase PreA subunit